MCRKRSIYNPTPRIKAHTLRIWEQRYQFITPKRTETNIRYYNSEDLKLVLNVSRAVARAMQICSGCGVPIREHFKTVYVGDHHEHTVSRDMMPLAFGIVPKKYQQSVVDFVKSRGMASSVYGSQFLLEGLYRAGEADYALKLMTATHDRSWWNMIAMGSTITLEAWDMKYKPNADWNHAWGAAPANIIPRYLWGITPKTPGFGIISIRPQFGNLKQSSIQVPTLKGPVKGSYTYVNDRRQEYTIELPANSAGEFYLEPSPSQTIQLNGEPVNPAFETIRLAPGVGGLAGYQRQSIV